MRVSARSAVGSTVAAFVVVLSAIVLALTATIQSAVSLLAGTALIVPGTGTPNPQDSPNYLDNSLNYYVAPAVTRCDGTAGNVCGTVPVPYIAQFWPIPLSGWGGLEGAKWNDSVQSGVESLTGLLTGPNNPSSSTDPDAPVVSVFGYSQGATVASIVKRNLRDLSQAQKDNMEFVLIGNPNRPNGGLFERLAILGTVPILDATFGQPTPTDIGIETTDIVMQYDGVGDFTPAPINVLAVLNSLAGFWYVHGTYLAPRGDDPADATPFGYTSTEIEQIVAACVADSSGPNCGEHGDTIYVTIPARSLPIMQPFIDIGNSTGASALINPVVALLQPVTQTLIEIGYERGDYGVVTPFRVIPRFNPIEVVSDLIADIPEGINAAVATINSPTHTIPNLPPSWGTDGAADTAILAKGAKDPDKATPDLGLLPKLKLTAPERLSLTKFRDAAVAAANDKATSASTTTDATKPDKPKVGGQFGPDIHPVRDLSDAIKKTLTKPRGIERALSHRKPAKPEAANQD